MSKTPLSDMRATRDRAQDFSAFGGLLPNPDPILRANGKSISTYRDLCVDAHVGGCVRRRKSAVKGLERGIDRGNASSRIARSVESILGDLDIGRIVDEMLDAPLFGYQPMEVMWQAAGGLIVPVDVIGKPPEWFCFDKDNALRLKTRASPTVGELLPPRKFLLPRQDATYQNPYGFPDLSLCFWPVFFKKGGVRLWLQFVEKYGSAFAVGKLPRSATSAERSEMLDALDEMIASGVATIPDDGSVDLKELAGKGASAELFENLAMFCRSEVSIALLGTNQTTEANSNRASAAAGLEVARDLRDGDASIVASAINTLIRWVVEINWPGQDAPTYSFWDQEALDALQASRDKSNYEAGARFTNAYWMRAYGYQADDLVPEETATDLSAGAPGKPVSFAEGGEASGEFNALINAQTSLDDSLDRAIESGIDWDAIVDPLLKPVLNALQNGMAPEEALIEMASWYPEMDDKALEELFARALFVADIWGQLSAQEDEVTDLPAPQEAR